MPGERQLWPYRRIPLKQLSTEPSLRSRVPDLENQVKTLTDKLTNIDNTRNQRTAEMQQKWRRVTA